ncbi:MAG: pilus assembly protein PilM [Patescibacteria group bacterium]|nr:pilus assembly protein PilM [Patescibacteria group bacterium]
MIFNLFKNKFLGIDLGSLNIKIVEVAKKGKAFEVVNFGIIPIINFKEIISSSYIFEEQVAMIINEFIKEGRVRAKDVVLNVLAPYVFPINFWIPNIPEKSLPQVIRFESQKQIPLGLDEIEIEYRYLQTEMEQTKQWLIFLTGTPKNYLRKIETIINLLHLNLKSYGIEYFNYEPYFKNILGNFVIIDLGHAYSTLSLVRNSKIIYGAKLKIRGYDFLDSLINLTKNPETEILDLVAKKGFSFSPEERDFRYLTNNFLTHMSNLIQAEIEKLEDGFYIKIDKIFWTGGLSILPGFKSEMLTRLSKYQQDLLLPFSLFSGDKFSALKDRATIFSQVLGVVYRKLLG